LIETSKKDGKTGAMKSTPTIAMETKQDLTSLPALAKKEAVQSAFKFLIWGTWKGT
jgi:hypothetical protein